MSDNEKDKSSEKKGPHIDSAELLEALFRKELDRLSAREKANRALKKDGKRGSVKKPKSSYQLQDATRKNASSQKAAGKRKIVKRFPVSQVKGETPKKAAPKRDTMLRKAVRGKNATQLKDEKQEEIILEDVIEIGERKGAEMGFGGKLAQNSDKIKIASLCVVLVVAVGFIINSLGIVDLGRLVGLSEPTEKRSMKTRAVSEPPAKKPAPVIAKSPQQKTTPSAPERTTSQMRKRIVQKPPETTTPFANSGVAQRPSKRVLPTRPPVNTQRPSERHAPAQEPVVTQEPTTTSTSTPTPMVAKAPAQPSPPMQEPVIATRGPEPAISAQNPDVPDQPAEPATIEQEQPVTKRPVQPFGSTQEPPIAKDLPQASAPRIQPSAAKATTGSEEPARREAAFGKQEIAPEDSDLSYPYSVYLGSFKTRGRAAKAISDYQSKGLSPYCVKVDLAKKGVWYRVFVGRFETRDRAEAFISEKGLADAEVMKTEHVAPEYAYSATDDKLEKEDSKKEISLSAAAASSYPYSIYLGSYQSRELADQAVSKYGKKALSPYWVKIDLGDKGVWYRVFSEYFEKRGQADEFIAKNQIRGAESRHTRYANLVGIFASQKELDEEKVLLTKLGWCPYVIQGPNGQSRLYVGAFYQKARAQKQHAELASKGIHSQIVER